MTRFRVKRISIFSLIVCLLINACSTTDIQNTDVPKATRTPNTVATVSFEQTAIARFTENPELASSMTPFYGAILWIEAIRQITETPVFDSERECYLVADYWKMSDLEDNVESNLLENDILVFVTAFVSVLWNSENCDQYLPVSNRINIQFEADDAPDLESIINIVSTEALLVADLSPDLLGVEISIYADSSLVLFTNMQKISDALANSLTGDVLIDELHITQTSE